MSKSRLIGGIVCLAAAALLAVLNVVLPADEFVFTVGDTNAPIVPVIILAIVGLVLLLTARERRVGGDTTTSQGAQAESVQANEKVALNKRLETIGWALFLIMIGGSGLVPKEQVPEGVWSIGVGLIMLGLNAARYYYKIKMSTFTIVLGSLALLTGVGELLGVDLPAFAILLILIGASIILKPLFEKEKS